MVRVLAWMAPSWLPVWSMCSVSISMKLANSIEACEYWCTCGRRQPSKRRRNHAKSSRRAKREGAAVEAASIVSTATPRSTRVRAAGRPGPEAEAATEATREEDVARGD